MSVSLSVCPSAKNFPLLQSVYVVFFFSFWLLGVEQTNLCVFSSTSSYIIFIHAYVWDSSSAFPSPHRQERYLNGLMQRPELVP